MNTPSKKSLEQAKDLLSVAPRYRVRAVAQAIDDARADGHSRTVVAVEWALHIIRDEDIGFDPSSVRETNPAVAADKAFNYAVRKLRKAARNAL